MVRSCNPGTRRLEASPGWGSGHNGAAGGSYLSRPHLQVPMSNLLAVDRTDKIVKSDAARRAQLTPERYRIVPQHDTERAYCINGAALAFKPGDP